MPETLAPKRIEETAPEQKELPYISAVKRSGLTAQFLSLSSNKEYWPILESFSKKLEKDKNIDRFEGAVLLLDSLSKKGISAARAEQIMNKLDGEYIYATSAGKNVSLVELVGTTHVGIHSATIEKIEDALTSKQANALESFADDFTLQLGKMLAKNVDENARWSTTADKIAENIRTGGIYGLLISASKITRDILADPEFQYSTKSFENLVSTVNESISPDKLMKEIISAAEGYDKSFAKTLSDDFYKSEYVPVLKYIPILGAFAKHKTQDMKESILFDTMVHTAATMWSNGSNEGLQHIRERVITNRLVEFANQHVAERGRKKTQTENLNAIESIANANYEMLGVLRTKDETAYRDLRIKEIFNPKLTSLDKSQAASGFYDRLCSEAFKAYGIENDAEKQELLRAGFPVEKMDNQQVQLAIGHLNKVKKEVFGSEEVTLKNIQDGIASNNPILNRESAAYKALSKKGYEDKTIALTLYVALPTLIGMSEFYNDELGKKLGEIIRVEGKIGDKVVEPIPPAKMIGSVIKNNGELKNMKLTPELGSAVFLSTQIMSLGSEMTGVDYQARMAVAAVGEEEGPKETAAPAKIVEKAAVWEEQDLGAIRKNIPKTAEKIAGSANKAYFAKTLDKNMASAEAYFGKELFVIEANSRQGFITTLNNLKYSPDAVAYYGAMSWMMNDRHYFKKGKTAASVVREEYFKPIYTQSIDKKTGKAISVKDDVLSRRFDQGYKFFMKNEGTIKQDIGDAEFAKLEDAAALASKTLALNKKDAMATLWAIQVGEYDFEKYNGGSTFMEQWYSGYKKAKNGIEVTPGDHASTIERRLNGMKLKDGSYRLAIVDAAGSVKQELMDIEIKKGKAKAGTKVEKTAITTSDRIMLLDSKDNVAACSNASVAPLLFFAGKKEAGKPKNDGVWRSNFRKNGDVEIGIAPTSGWTGLVYMRAPPTIITREASKAAAIPTELPRARKPGKESYVPRLPMPVPPMTYDPAIREAIQTQLSISAQIPSISTLGGELAGWWVALNLSAGSSADQIATAVSGITQNLFNQFTNAILALPAGGAPQTYYYNTTNGTFDLNVPSSGPYLTMDVSRNANGVDVTARVYANGDQTSYIDIQGRIEENRIIIEKRTITAPFAGITFKNLLQTKVGPVYLDALARVIPVYAEYEDGRFLPEKLKTGTTMYQAALTASMTSKDFTTLPWDAELVPYYRYGYGWPSNKFFDDYGISMPGRFSTNIRTRVGFSKEMGANASIEYQIANNAFVEIGAGMKRIDAAAGVIAGGPVYPMWLSVHDARDNGLTMYYPLFVDVTVNGEGVLLGPPARLIGDIFSAAKTGVEYTGLKKKPIKVIEQ